MNKKGITTIELLICFVIVIIITLNNPTRNGYNFTGWSGTGLNGSGNMTVRITKGSTGDRTYTVHWEAVPPPPPPSNTYSGIVTCSGCWCANGNSCVYRLGQFSSYGSCQVACANYGAGCNCTCYRD